MGLFDSKPAIYAFAIVVIALLTRAFGKKKKTIKRNGEPLR